MPALPPAAQAILDRLEAGKTIFEEDAREQEDVLAALESDPRKITAMPNVLGVAFGFLPDDDVETAKPTAIVMVTEKVPLATLKPEERVPANVLVGTRKVPIRVLAIGGIEPLCNPGDNGQHQAPHNPYEPGCVIADLIPPDNVIRDRGTGGCLVREAGDPTAPVYLLTCAHVIIAGHNVGHPGKEVIGSWLANAAGGIDACICEVTAAVSKILCLGHPNRAMAPPLGAIVKKSGATTGMTVGRVLHIGRVTGKTGTIVSIGNSNPILPQTGTYLGPGDSGSVSLLGWPWFDLGPVTEAKLQKIAAGLPQPAATQLLWMLRAQFFNAAVCLNFAQSKVPPGEPGPAVLAYGHVMPEVLAAFQPPLEIVS
jgi:hypothetical protein